jgi:hypothetical protein
MAHGGQIRQAGGSDRRGRHHRIKPTSRGGGLILGSKEGVLTGVGLPTTVQTEWREATVVGGAEEQLRAPTR